MPAGHWAYDAVSQLVKDGLIIGYPDGQFKGNRPMTRYEAAVLTYRAVDQIEAQITAGKAVAQADIDAVKKLLAAFGKELKDVEAHVAALQKTVDGHTKSIAAVKAEADATQLRVNQGKIGFQVLDRPGTSYSNVQAINGGAFAIGATAPVGAAGVTPGNRVVPGAGVSTANSGGTGYSFGPGGLNTSSLGGNSHGTQYTLARFILGGQLDPRWSYGLRVSDKLAGENGLGGVAVTPSFCTTTTTTNCSFSDLNNGQGTLPLNLDYGYIGYSSPGGISAQFGRFSNGSYGRYVHPPASLIYAGGQETGFNVGYQDPHGHLFAQMYYGIPSVPSYSLAASSGTPQGVCSQNVVGLNYASGIPGGQASLANINPYCNASQSEIGGWVLYYLSGPRVAIGGTTDNIVGKQYTFYNPSAVDCTVPIAGVKTKVSALSTTSCTANGGTFGAGLNTGNYLTAQTTTQLVEGYGTVYMGPKSLPTWNLAFAYDANIGVNPFAGGTAGGNFADNSAYSASLTYASKGNLYSTGSNNNPFVAGGGRRNSNVAQVIWEWYGLNSVGGIQSSAAAGTVSYTNNTGFTNFNGMHYYGAEFGHWFSDSVRFSVEAFHLQNNNGTLIPIGTNGTANANAGLFVNSINVNQLNAEAYLYFF